MFYAWYLKVDKFLATLATCLKYLTRLKKYLVFLHHVDSWSSEFSLVLLWKMLIFSLLQSIIYIFYQINIK